MGAGDGGGTAVTCFPYETHLSPFNSHEITQEDVNAEAAECVCVGWRGERGGQEEVKWNG